MTAPREAHAAFPCAYTAAVLAVCLDGDPTAVAAPPSLPEHLAGCPDCHAALHRARRLDAVLAEQAGRVVAVLDRDPALGAAWLAAAVAPTTPTTTTPVGTDPATRRSRWLAGTALLVATAAALVLALAAPGPRPAPSFPAVAPTTTASAGAAASPDPGGDPGTADHAGTTAEGADGAAAARPILLASAPPRPSQARPSLLGQTPRGADEVERLCALLDEATDAARAAHLLLAHGGPRAERAVCDWVGRTASGPDLDTVLQRLRTQPGVTQRLAVDVQRSHAGGRPRSDDELLPLIIAAARIGGRPLDTALQRAGQRDQRLAEVVAAALRSAAPRAGRAALLLDLWPETSAPDTEEGIAFRLFAGQDRAMTHELVEQVQQAGSADRRRRAILALGVLADPSALDFLQSLLHRSARPDAMAAAWALCRYPARALRGLEGPRPRGHGDLLATALLAAGAPLPVADPRTARVLAGHAAAARTSVRDFGRFADLLRSSGIGTP